MSNRLISIQTSRFYVGTEGSAKGVGVFCKVDIECNQLVFTYDCRRRPASNWERDCNVPWYAAQFIVVMMDGREWVLNASHLATAECLAECPAALSNHSKASPNLVARVGLCEVKFLPKTHSSQYGTTGLFSRIRTFPGRKTRLPVDRQLAVRVVETC